MGKNREKYNAYMRKYMLARYHKRRAAAVEILGGTCARCGSCDDLQIDHLEPQAKQLNIGACIHTVSWARVELELKKCQLLCRLCHEKKSRMDGSDTKDSGAIRTCACGKTFGSGRAWGGHRGGKGACTA